MEPLNRACNIADFDAAELRAAIREVLMDHAAQDPDFPSANRRQWEMGMAAVALRQTGVLHPHSEVLMLGSGVEPTVFWLTTQVRRVFAIDRYGDPDPLYVRAPADMLTDAARYATGPWRQRRLVVQHMDTRNLDFEDDSFDAVVISSSETNTRTVEHTVASVKEAHRVLKPGGTLSLSAALLVTGDPDTDRETPAFTETTLRDLIVGDDRWQPFESQFDISPATLQRLSTGDDASQSLVLRSDDGDVLTSVHLTLLKLGRPKQSTGRVGAQARTIAAAGARRARATLRARLAEHRLIPFPRQAGTAQILARLDALELAMIESHVQFARALAELDEPPESRREPA